MLTMEGGCQVPPPAHSGVPPPLIVVYPLLLTVEGVGARYHHLLIMEALGGDQAWLTRFLAQVVYPLPS